MKKELLNELLDSSNQSEITSLIINDVLGGKIMCSKTNHYYNLVGCECIDLSIDKEIDYKDSKEVNREDLLCNEEIKERYIKLLSEVRKNIIDLNIDKLVNEKRLYDYFDYINEYYYFTSYEIDNYSFNNNIEHVRIELAFVNTGCFIDVDYNIDTDEYSYSIDYCGINKKDGLVLNREFFDIAFDYARKNKDSISLEKKLTDCFANLR